MKVVRLVFLGMFFCAASACARHTRGPESQGSTPFVHRVQHQGETLAAISSWYTGSQANWRKLAAINPEVDPSAMQIGDKIKIPAAIVVRRDPMSREAIFSNDRSKRARLSTGKDSNREMLSEPEQISDDQILPPGNSALLSTSSKDQSLQAEVLRDRMEETLLRDSKSQ